MRANCFRLMVLCTAVIFVPATAVSKEKKEKRWSAQVGLSPGHNNNFFSRPSDEPRESSDILNIYGAAEIERKPGKGKVKAFVRAKAIFASDIDDADHQRLTLGTQYKRGRNRITGEFFTNPDRLAFSDELGSVEKFDLQGYEIGWRRSLSRGIWVGVTYEAKSRDFDEIESQRGSDSDKETVGATARLPLGRRSGIRASLFHESKDASAPDFNWEGEGFSLRLDTRPRKDLELSARYKRRSRDYEDAPEGDSNFMREDTVEDFTVTVRWSLGDRWLIGKRRLAGERWGVQLHNRYRAKDSTREDRDFSSNEIEAGVYFLF